MLREKEDLLLKELLKECRYKPGRVIIHRGSKCQNNCNYCKEKEKNTPPIPVNLIVKIIKDSADTGAEMIAFYGGEPSLYDDLPFLVKETVKSGLKASITTNGSSNNCINEKYLKNLLSNKFISLTLSLSSINPEISDKIAGREGHYERQYCFLELVKRLISAETDFFVNITVMKENYQELPLILSFLRRYEFIKDIFLLPVKGAPESYLTIEMINDYEINIKPQILNIRKELTTKKYSIFFRDAGNLFGQSEEEIIRSSYGLYAITGLNDICAASLGEIFIASDNKNPEEVNYYSCCRSYLAGIPLFDRSFSYSEMDLKRFMEYFDPFVHGVKPEEHTFCRTECNKHIAAFNKKFMEEYKQKREP